MQTTKDMDELVKRARYYQGLIDIDNIEKGQNYSALHDTYIIFICTFGVFTGKRHKYTFRNLCIESNEILLNDGTTKLFLSTKGKAEGKIEAIRNAIKDGLTTLTWAPRCFLGAFFYGIFKALIYALCRKLV